MSCVSPHVMATVLCDIDGVLLHNNAPLDGACDFIARLEESEHDYLLITNYPSQTPQDLANRLSGAGMEVSAERIFTSAMAVGAFLARQKGRKAYVVGEGALSHELYGLGFTLTDVDPDFVVVGETRAFNWDMIHKAAKLIAGGARFIATNPDTAGPDFQPACGALCASIERITGREPFYVGKPSPWIVRAALNSLNAHSENSVFVGDNMATDILAGTQAGMRTILVLSGVTSRADLERYPFQPNHVFASVGEIDLAEL